MIRDRHGKRGTPASRQPLRVLHAKIGKAIARGDELEALRLIAKMPSSYRVIVALCMYAKRMQKA